MTGDAFQFATPYPLKLCNCNASAFTAEVTARQGVVETSAFVKPTARQALGKTVKFSAFLN